MKNVSSSYARQHLKACCDIAAGGEPVIVTRQNGGDCVIVSLERFSFYEEMADKALHEKAEKGKKRK
jgi:prevent-host-death family protein